MKLIKLPCNNLLEELKSADGDVEIRGQVTLKDVKILSECSYNTLDISKAVFGNEDEEYSVYRGMSHSGPMYGASGVKSVDILTRLLQRIEVFELILPDDVAKRHINAILKNTDIYAVKVLDGCKLFSMESGCLYNKKKTTLLFEPRPIEYVPCPECGKEILKSHLIKPVDGPAVCPDCLVKNYHQCYWCRRWYSDSAEPGKKWDWCWICPECCGR